MRKYISFVAIAFAWFLVSGVFLAEKEHAGHWLGTLFMYVICLRWVFSWTFKLTMYTPYSGTELQPTEEHRMLRGLLMLIGLSGMLVGSLI